MYESRTYNVLCYDLQRYYARYFRSHFFSELFSYLSVLSTLCHKAWLYVSVLPHFTDGEDEVQKG